MSTPRIPIAAESVPPTRTANSAPTRVRLNSRGQITIPQPLRALLKLKHGDVLELRHVAERLLEVRVLRQRDATRRKGKSATPARPVLEQLPQGFALPLDSFLGDLRESAAQAGKAPRS
jgi:AbrB family looped-hinge helix DNA binding protein